jgi:hypothetical protein
VATPVIPAQRGPVSKQQQKLPAFKGGSDNMYFKLEEILNKAVYKCELFKILSCITRNRDINS